MAEENTIYYNSTKVFDNWNEIKKKTHKNKRKIGIKSREIFWVKIGQNIGDEEYGKDEFFLRPVIIIKQLTSDIFIGIPTTTTFKKNNDYFHKISYYDKKKSLIQSYSMIYQFKTFSKKRLLTKIGMVNKKDFIEIIKKLSKIIVPTY